MEQHVAGVDVLGLGQCRGCVRVILAQDRKRSVVRGPDVIGATLTKPAA